MGRLKPLSPLRSRCLYDPTGARACITLGRDIQASDGRRLPANFLSGRTSSVSGNGHRIIGSIQGGGCTPDAPYGPMCGPGAGKKASVDQPPARQKESVRAIRP